MKSAPDDLELLLVEDNPADVYLIKKMLRSSPLHIKNIYETDRVDIACRVLSDHTINLALLDLSLPDSFGIDSFFGIKEAAKKTPIIILTGFADTSTALQAIKEGAKDYLIKSEINETLLSRAILYSLQRQQQDEKLRESEEKYRQMFHRNPFPSLICDISTLKILEVNDAAIEKYGYNKDEFLKLNLSSLRPPEDVPELLKAIAETDFSGVNGKILRHKKKNGEILFMESTYYPINYFGKTAIQSQMNDVTEKIKLEQELEEQRALKELQITTAVLEAQEKERTAIGEELHDNINQIISTIKMYIGMAIKSPDKSNELLGKGMEYATLAIEENRKLAKELILPQLKGQGLIQSLEEFAEEARITSPFSIHLDAKDIDENLFSGQQKISLYRIIQEQMHNISKYAQATVVSIRLFQEKDKVILYIEDNGKGFDTSVRSKGVGLTNINSRAVVLNGKVKIDSEPGKGCRLEIIMDAKAG